MALLTVLLVLVGGAIGGRQGALIAFGAAAVMNFWGFWFSDKAVLRHYRAQEAGPADHPKLYNMVQALSQRAGLPVPKVYIIPQKTPNAFATGRDPRHAAVAATEGIMSLLDDDELAGVMAHELTHVKNRDTLTSTIAATFAGAIALTGQLGMVSRRGSSQRRQNPIGGLLLIIGAPLAGMLIRLAISRVREYAADAGAAQISGKPRSLADALAKLHQGAQRIPLRHGNPAHSHLFIIHPFTGGLNNLMSTHPPIAERIKRLEAMAAGGTEPLSEFRSQQ